MTGPLWDLQRFGLDALAGPKGKPQGLSRTNDAMMGWRRQVSRTRR